MNKLILTKFIYMQEILIKKREYEGIKHLNDLNAFNECSNTMDDVYENIHDYTSNRKRKNLDCF